MGHLAFSGVTGMELLLIFFHWLLARYSLSNLVVIFLKTAMTAESALDENWSQFETRC
jgi:hypothetical protein